MLNLETTATCEHCGGIGKVPTPGDLRNLRLRAGMTLREVADPAGVTAAYLSDVERGNRPLSPRIRRVYERIT